MSTGGPPRGWDPAHDMGAAAAVASERPSPSEPLERVITRAREACERMRRRVFVGYRGRPVHEPVPLERSLGDVTALAGGRQEPAREWTQIERIHHARRELRDRGLL